ncbi:MAG: DinB family protein [Janthinobacterium lividum]
MKSYFTRLFDYDQYANQLLLKTIIEAGSPEKPVLLMAHLLGAQKIWLGRCKQEITNVALWPDWQVDKLEALISENNQQWINFINILEIAAFEEIVSYQNSKGQNFKNTLSDIIAHVINHGTHHRAQAGQHLKLAGIETLPLTDYIFFVR